MPDSKTTDQEMALFEERWRKAAAEAAAQGAAFYDAGLDAQLTEEEQEPGYWERQAAFLEKVRAYRKAQAQQNGTATGETPESSSGK